MQQSQSYSLIDSFKNIPVQEKSEFPFHLLRSSTRNYEKHFIPSPYNISCKQEILDTHYTIAIKWS